LKNIFRNYPLITENSPIGHLYDLGVKILLLGVDYDKCTSLYLAEYRAKFDKKLVSEGCAMSLNGERVWQ
tara:strand:+ start:332 stop:541 length:210 start_codon:yes stop_codon:yes gene_type:complete